MLAGLFGMMFGVGMMAMRDVGMVSSLLMISGGVMLSGCAVVFRGVLVMLGCFQMVFFAFFRHGVLFLRNA